MSSALELDAEPAWEWFTLTHWTQTLIGGRGPDALGPGYDRALEYARDLAARPHDPAARDKVAAECRAVADALVKIAAEEGHAGFLVAALKTMLLDTVQRETNGDAHDRVDA